ncbi:phosphatidate cytidylyltransferase [Mesocricetibacter intestinalis]|uniref:Phosphatidate cytidylyltransferase n=1 Tax=Mesocricetibacter intestinalis TaxID=1521930 RepID=A0A4R6VL07_9PAST|nr:phosphatidate cytidylyltransferase [Mesocricetibacter intestinalis]TDQ59490.1 phosphatidate cytidylyltransferase [Mesocricetibacter intestinalis]
MLKQRILSALILIAAVFAALFLFSPYYFALTLGIVVILAFWEWTQFIRFKQSVWRFVATAIAATFLFLLLYSQNDYLNAGRVFRTYAEPLLLTGVIWWTAALMLVVSYPKSAALWRHSLLLQIIFAFFSLVPFLIAVLQLRLNQYVQNPHQGIILLLYVFILVWAADSGAYFAGRRFGKHKLAPKVSPGKTWQGVVGGLVTACIFAFIFIQTLGEALFSVNSPLSLILLSVATVAVSILGDLTESMFKRESGIKDSGRLIPGHGGVLDRIDSLTAAVPFFAYFYFFVL